VGGPKLCRPLCEQPAQELHSVAHQRRGWELTRGDKDVSQQGAA
jgi:hypothetical protein